MGDNALNQPITEKQERIANTASDRITEGILLMRANLTDEGFIAFCANLSKMAKGMILDTITGQRQQCQPNNSPTTR